MRFAAIDFDKSPSRVIGHGFGIFPRAAFPVLCVFGELIPQIVDVKAQIPADHFDLPCVGIEIVVYLDAEHVIALFHRLGEFVEIDVELLFRHSIILAKVQQDRQRNHSS